MRTDQCQEVGLYRVREVVGRNVGVYRYNVEFSGPVYIMTHEATLQFSASHEDYIVGCARASVSKQKGHSKATDRGSKK